MSAKGRVSWKCLSARTGLSVADCKRQYRALQIGGAVSRHRWTEEQDEDLRRMPLGAFCKKYPQIEISLARRHRYYKR
jgi:hypothetical protein